MSKGAFSQIYCLMPVFYRVHFALTFLQIMLDRQWNTATLHLHPCLQRIFQMSEDHTDTVKLGHSLGLWHVCLCCPMLICSRLDRWRLRSIPTTADPNGALTKRTDSDEDQVVPPLTKCAGFTNANAAQTDTIKTLISMWTDSGLDAGQRQVSVVSTFDCLCSRL